MRAGAGGEDVEDQLGAIEHLHARGLLQIAGLGGGEVVVEDHHVGFMPLDKHSQFGHLASAEVGGLVGGIAPLCDLGQHISARGFRQARQLIQRVFQFGSVAIKQARKHGPLALNAVGACAILHVPSRASTRRSASAALFDTSSGVYPPQGKGGTTRPTLFRPSPQPVPCSSPSGVCRGARRRRHA